MTDNFRALCAELLSIFETYDDESNLVGIYDDLKATGNDILQRAAAALATPEGSPEHQPDKALNLVTNCIITGPPPEPFTHWQDYFDDVQKSGVMQGLKISASERLTEEWRSRALPLPATSTNSEQQ